jgi:hypothetical protein
VDGAFEVGLGVEVDGHFSQFFVMAGLVPAIHVFIRYMRWAGSFRVADMTFLDAMGHGVDLATSTQHCCKTWMAGTSPAMAS